MNKKLIKQSKGKKTLKVQDIYDIMQADTLNERRSMRIKVNTFKKDDHKISKENKKKQKTLPNISDLLDDIHNDNEINIKSDEATNKKKNNSKKTKNNKENKINIPDVHADDLNELEIPETNKILKVNKIHDKHKYPLKFSKKTFITEENPSEKINSLLLNYINEINILEIYNILKNENKSSTENNFDIYSIKGNELEKIFLQAGYVNELTLYEKIYTIFDVIMYNCTSLELIKVLVFLFAFMKNNLNNIDIFELIFSYFSGKISEIFNSKNKFLNNFENLINNSENKEIISAKGIFNILFGRIFQNYQNEFLFENIFVKNEFLEIEYLISYCFSILFYFNIENFYLKNFDTKSILIFKSFNFFRLIQDFLMNINYDSYLEITNRVFGLFNLYTEKVEIENLFIPENLYVSLNLVINKNKIMVAEEFKEKIFTKNFFYLIKNLFVCNINNSNDVIVEKNQDDSIKNNLFTLFKKLLDDIINNSELKENSIENSISFLNNKSILLKIIEIAQFIELALKICKVPLVYSCVFKNILWVEFTKTNEKSYLRRVVLYIISLLFKFFLVEDFSFKFEQTKNLMNWLYAIIDPQFEGK